MKLLLIVLLLSCGVNRVNLIDFVSHDFLPNIWRCLPWPVFGKLWFNVIHFISFDFPYTARKPPIFFLTTIKVSFLMKAIPRTALQIWGPGFNPCHENQTKPLWEKVIALLPLYNIFVKLCGVPLHIYFIFWCLTHLQN